eukprot:11180576-Alexandrium_andersonii.AAC.1
MVPVLVTPRYRQFGFGVGAVTLSQHAVACRVADAVAASSIATVVAAGGCAIAPRVRACSCWTQRQSRSFLDSRVRLAGVV